MKSNHPKTASAHKRRLHGVVMRWARMEMAVRMASVGGTEDGDEMSDDAETAKLEVIQTALPGKWRQWRKATKALNNTKLTDGPASNQKP